ncbi:ATP-binding protein [Kineosporia sp. NBRC 101731]|uniref:ATP-binding protein n=1 Tax=Kineosporia sp. NBRC 101731 TaxID=3032199 RepID=UPI0024A017A4|nr:ATP-binding protein [Kineosporia sp. NBRC 101731]GLY29486.1 ATPase [Kineosporia sp. NBRC 101731]
MGESLSVRWQRFLDGLDEAVRRRAPARDRPAGAESDRDISILESCGQAVRQAWTSAPDLFARIDESLDDLAAAVGLTEFETDLVAVTLAADLDPSLAVALDRIRPFGGPKEHPTIGPVLELLGIANVVPQVRAALRPGGSLQLTGLLRVPDTGPFLTRSLVLPDRVAAHLLGDHTPDATLGACLVTPCPLDLPGGGQVLEHWRSGPGLVWVHGPQGSAGLAMVAGAAARLGLEVVAVDLSRADDDPAGRLDAAVLEAVLCGGALIVTGRAEGTGAQLVHRLSEAPVPVAVVAATAWDPAWAGWLPPVVPALRLSDDQRESLWSGQLGERSPDGEVRRDLMALRVTPEEIRAVGDLARSTTENPTAEDLLQAARRLGDQAGTMRRAEVTLDDLVLPASLRGGLEEMIRWGRHRDAVLAQGPLMGRGRGRGIAALFAGGSGTGKTMAAQAIAGSLGLDLYQVDLATVVDKYVGESEKRLAKIFATAERLNCVLFFDEADALFGSRSAVQDAHDRYANLEVSYLLQRLEQFDGIVVLATNLRGNLDSAFTRRLQFILNFPEPDHAGRVALWGAHLQHVAQFDLDDPIDIEALSCVDELSGGVIRNVVLSAAFAAFDDSAGRVGHRHVTSALQRELRKMGRRDRPGIPRRRTPVTQSAADMTAGVTADMTADVVAAGRTVRP